MDKMFVCLFAYVGFCFYLFGFCWVFCLVVCFFCFCFLVLFFNAHLWQLFSKHELSVPGNSQYWEGSLGIQLWEWKSVFWQQGLQTHQSVVCFEPGAWSPVKTLPALFFFFFLPPGQVWAAGLLNPLRTKSIFYLFLMQFSYQTASGNTRCNVEEE